MQKPPQDDFKLQVYAVLNSIPAGSVVTYGRLASLAGKPNGARQIGAILKQLPMDSSLPWHRVVNAQRRSSFPEGTDRYIRQMELLMQDGTVFMNGRITKASFI